MGKGKVFRWASIIPKDEQTLQPLKAIDYAFGLFVFFVAFGVYLRTLTPTVGFHDSGELITVAYTLGIAHPPGYPLYTIFGKLWTTLIPIGNIAFRMNMESALFASLAVMMVYFIILKLSTRAPEHQSTRIIPALVASLILAFSLTFWEQAVIAEKYTLNALFATLIIFILLKWQETQNSKLKTQNYLYLFAFILGLSFTHHFQTIYLVPASVFFILVTLLNRRDRETQRKKLKTQNSKLKTILSQLFALHSSLFTLSKMALLFVLPLTLWVYLPLRASQEPVLNWGDPSTWDNFTIHILAKSYTGYFSILKESFIRFGSHLNFFLDQFSKYILWIPFLGIPFFLKRKILFFFFLLIFIVNALHSIRYTVVNIQDYYIPSFILISIIMGIGLSFIARFLPFLSFFLFFLLILPIHSNHFQSTRDKFFFSYDYGINILRPLKKEVIVFSYGDYDTFPLWYLQYVEERRMDVTNLTWMFLACDWHIEAIKRFHPKVSFEFEEIPYKDLKYHNIGRVINERLNKIIESNFREYPIYVGRGVEGEKGIRENFLLLPDGVFSSLLPKNIDKKRLSQELEKTQLIFLMQGKGFKDRVTSNIWSNYAISYNNKGNLYRQINLEKAIVEYNKALDIDQFYLPSKLNLAFAYIDKKSYNNAKIELERIFKEDTNFNPSLVHYGLGLIYQKKEDFKKAISEYIQVLKIDPNNVQTKEHLEQCKKFLDEDKR